MIRVLFFDLGMTLVDANDRPFPHVAEALETIKTFVSADGKALSMALVSDFDMPAAPATAARIRTIFNRYLAILDTTGLRAIFEPVQRHVTLSSHAGVFKPDRRVFEKALARLKSKASLDQCLFVTENHDHVRAVRTTLGMRALEFKTGASTTFDFDDWTQAPAMIAHIVAPDGQRNADAALRHFLDKSHGFELQSVDKESVVTGTLWKPVGSKAGQALSDVHAPFTVSGKVQRGRGGEIRGVRFDEPSAEEVSEAASFVRGLAQHGQAGTSARRAQHGVTHEIETDDAGRRRLVRKRFRAV